MSQSDDRREVLPIPDRKTNTLTTDYTRFHTTALCSPYFAPGATHAPHHVPPEWIAKYKGKCDQRWDTVREETFARQKKLGVIPSDCDLTPRLKEIPAWSDIEERFRQAHGPSAP